MSGALVAAPGRPPLVIGGLGGSGTRLVAELAQESGFFLGADLNHARDNLWFTLLFKRPAWYPARTERDPRQLELAAAMLERALTGRGPLQRGSWGLLGQATAEAVRGRHGQTRAFTPGWPLAQAARLARALAVPVRRAGPWGWKEPNSHVFLGALAERWPEMKFIYVNRHGLDMAYSRNQAQLHNWGPLFGVRAEGPPGTPQPRAMLEFWLRALERVAEAGPRLLGRRFLLLNYDELATRPDAALPGLVEFLGIDPRDAPQERLRALAVASESIGRHRRHDLSVFDPAQIDAVRSRGFEVGE
ncbi:MAG: sulfotransferase [Acidobacteria bacterium]|nr:sulfotransferase [Acidobacteriota bacterium]